MSSKGQQLLRQMKIIAEMKKGNYPNTQTISRIFEAAEGEHKAGGEIAPVHLVRAPCAFTLAVSRPQIGERIEVALEEGTHPIGGGEHLLDGAFHRYHRLQLYGHRGEGF